MGAISPFLRIVSQMGEDFPWKRVQLVCCALLILGIGLTWAFSSMAQSAWALPLLAFVCGAATMTLCVQWFGLIYEAGRSHGRGHCVLLIIVCGVIALVLALPVVFTLALGLPAPVELVAALVPAFAELACLLVKKEAGEAQEAAGPIEARRYHLTPYAVPLLICFGATWGVASEIGVVYFDAAAWWNWAILLLMSAAMFFIMARFPKSKGMSEVQFGLMIRLAVALSGVLLIAAPSSPCMLRWRSSSSGRSSSWCRASP